MSFVQRLLGADFILAQGAFPTEAGAQPGANKYTIDPGTLRMRARIDRAGAASQAELNLDVYGMQLSVMNALSTLGYVATFVKKNQVVVRAGTSADAAQATVFSGTIYSAYVDLRRQPEAVFHCTATAAYIEAFDYADPSVYPKATPVTTILNDMANKMGVPFEPNDVTAVLPPSYFYGSLLSQAQQAVDAARINWNKLEDRTLAIWNPGSARGGPAAIAAAPLVSADTGLEGYPEYNSLGIQFSTIFNPNIGFGKPVNVQSSQLLQNIPIIGKGGDVIGVQRNMGSGLWGVSGMYHDLESLVPNGRWHSEIHCAPIGFQTAQS